MKKEMSCIVCPMGCSLTVEYEPGGEIIVTGNTCKRGISYAQDEVTNPTRTLTSTVKTNDGRYIPVKSDNPLPKDKLFDYMEVLKTAVSKVPILIGEVIVSDIGKTGVNIVATRNMD